MKKLQVLMLLVLVTVSQVSALTLEKGTVDLNNALQELRNPAEKLPVIVVMKEQYDSQLLYDQVRDLSKEERRINTIESLSSFSDRSQSEIRDVLLDMEKEGLVQDLRFLWITNVISFDAVGEALTALDTRGDIDRIEYDPPRPVLIGLDNEYESVVENLTSQTDSGDREIVYNVSLMNVPEVWDQGFMGAGVTVAVLDTGVNYNHNDIVNRMWTHNDYPNHGFNFVNNNHSTLDDHGHGTHCAGTIAGDGTSGSQTGVAPESQIMALKVLDSSGNGQESGVWSAIQFSVTNGADVMSLSLGWLHAWNPDRVSFRNAMDNALAAGVVASVAAGNEGNQQYMYPIPSNIRTPGDCPPPWLHPDQTLTGGISAVITVGATNAADNIANFSGRGPVTWQGLAPFNDYEYNPGIGLIRPDVVAPGVDIKSLVHYNNNSYRLMSGTSMATPNNAGVIALLLSKDPTMLPEEVSEVLETTALPLSTSKSNTFGSGRVDALAAINMVTADNPPNPATNPDPAVGDINVALMPTLNWSNGGGASCYFLSLGTDNPPTNIINDYLTEDRFYQVIEYLESETLYYWQVDSMNDNGTTEGEVWSFNTGLPVSEDFESGDFSGHDWQFTTAGTDIQEWNITSDESNTGLFSARSGEGGDSTITSLFITVEVAEPGVISFYRKVSTEENYDFLRFFINTTTVGQWSGELNWGYESYEVQPGIYTFRWLYLKNASNTSGEDTVWIDDITFPPLVEEEPPIIIPDNLVYELDLEYIHLTWELPEERDDELPILLGYNIYQAIDQDNEFNLLNPEPVEDNEYHILIDEAGEHHYYVTAFYDLGESEPSEAIEITINPSPEEPLINPPGGEYDQPVTVSIETDDPEISVFYTIDETDPDTESILYIEPIEITADLTLKIKLYKAGSLPGEVISHEYTFTSSAGDDIAELITDMKIYPNPFILNNPNLRNSKSLTIDLQLGKEAGPVQIDIYNVKGQLVTTLSPQTAAGQQEKLNWDLNQNNGRQVGSGIYFIRLIGNEEIINRRVMIIK